MKKIFENEEYAIYKANTIYCNTFLIEHREHLVLWDTSIRLEMGLILAAIKKTRRKKLSAIFISHAHNDHSANAQQLSELYQCSVYVSEKGVSILRSGICPIPLGRGVFGKVISMLAKKFCSIVNLAKVKKCEDVLFRFHGVITRNTRTF